MSGTMTDHGRAMLRRLRSAEHTLDACAFCGTTERARLSVPNADDPSSARYAWCGSCWWTWLLPEVQS